MEAEREHLLRDMEGMARELEVKENEIRSAMVSEVSSCNCVHFKGLLYLHAF